MDRKHRSRIKLLGRSEDVRVGNVLVVRESGFVHVITTLTAHHGL